MNRIIAKTGAVIVLITVVLFAVCMLIPFNFGSYFVCTILPIGYIIQCVVKPLALAIGI